MRRLIGCGVVMGLAGVVSASEGEPGAWEELFLRAHPVLVHFPIALLIVAVVFELVHLMIRGKDPDRKAISRGAMGLLAIGAISAGLSAWSGWENAEHNPPTSSVEDLMNLHRWLGIAVASTAGGALLFGLIGWGGGRLRVGLYRTLLIVSAGLVGVTGHFGGSIVWGESYLTDPLNEALFGSDEEEPAEGQDEGQGQRQNEDLAVQNGGGAVVPEALPRPSVEVIRASFERDVKPIFDARCIDCHGTDQSFGRLRLHAWDEIERIIDGRRDLFVSGLPDSSEIFHRVTLEEGSVDLMPADETGRLDDAQIEAIRAWIASLDPGAVGGEEPSEPEGSGLEVDDAANARGENAMERIRDAGGFASRVSLADDSVVVNLSMLGASANDATLSLLEGLEDSLVDLDLGSTSVGDVGVAQLARFPKLKRLDLSRTAVTNAGIAWLRGLGELESLNLYGTGVDDGASESLGRMVSLKNLYLWDSKFTAAGVEELQEQLAACEVDFGVFELGETGETGETDGTGEDGENG